MEKYVRVPVIDVHKDNLVDVWPGLLKAIYEATFIALDTELSGLGERKKLVAKSIEDRYKNLVEVAKSRSILAFGISCFQEDKDNTQPACTDEDNKTKTENIKYKVCTFNLSVLCSQEFVVEPASLQFLIQHGFDFNKQFSKGISYYKGSDKEHCDYTNASARHLFAHILLANKPVIFHNGLLDLVFLYHNFYSNIPDKLEVFTTDVHCMFSAGVLDTKYIADFKQRESASYLGYIFRKCQRYNTKCKESSQRHVVVQDFPIEPVNRQWVEYLYCNDPNSKSDDISGIQICDLYAAHGFCPRGADCHLSHDIDHILDKEESIISKKKRKNKKRKNDNGDACDIPSKRQPEVNESPSTTQEAQESRDENTNNTDNSTTQHIPQQSANNNITTGGHRAGIDAYMTGYCLATYLKQAGCGNLNNSGLVNKISLSGKEVPLTLACSHFSKPSLAHLNKMEMIKAKVHFKDV